MTLTAQPWALTRETVADVGRQGLNDGQLEAAITVVSMFNYFTRVADSSGIEFDYETPLPAFEPEMGQAPAPRPSRPASSRADENRSSRRPRNPSLRATWETWRSYVMESEKPISRRERRLLATVAAEESAVGENTEALGGPASLAGSDQELVRFARKLSRQPWTMEAADLARLRRVGYRDEALLHIIAVVAHQNADSRLVAGLGAAT